MQVSLETLSGLERKLTIEVPAETIDKQVKNRLAETAKTFQMKGFRKGKVPISVIKSRFGKGMRQEVLGDVMNQSYYEALTQENVRPAGQPKIEATNMTEGEDLAFTAIFEVFPEITIGDFSKIKVEKRLAEINDKDIDTMIETLREQRKHYHQVDRTAEKDDQLTIDFTGSIAGEEFVGGSAKGSTLIIGSGTMIPGFEDGLIGAKSGEDKKLKLKFPKDYHKEDLAGKACVFDVKVNSVAGVHYPELNEEFFKSFDIKGGSEKEFRAEVKQNMTRELDNAVKNNVKEQVLKGLTDAATLTLPKSVVDSEIDNLRQQAIQRYSGGSNQTIDASLLPAEMFQTQAEQRVTVGLIINEIIKENDLKASPAKVREIIEELAAGYENPKEVVAWYYSESEQLQQIEGMALEESVIDLILDKAKVDEKQTSYEEALKPIEKLEQEPEKKAKKKSSKAKPKAKADESESKK
ncbi:MAG: trigger factor [Gammaproteobacteria bacterium]|jgi:trigger factor|nr:trigger factor [Gammaproteobacteria bacterium]